MSAIADMTSGELVSLYRRRALSPVEVMRDVFARVDANAALNAFMPLDVPEALAAAKESEDRWRRGAPLGVVDGVPATIKDNIWLKGHPTRRGSKTSDPAPALEDSPATARLREQGAVLIGKTTMPEHGWIGVCHSPLTGITRNPWNTEHTPGGSTGGGAVAALLGLGVFHLGTDGAGSLRIPAAFTGVVGMKPTFGRVPVYPASALNVLSHQGPVTRTVTDAAQMLSIISGPDARDMAAWNAPAEDFMSGLAGGVRGLRIAWSPRLGFAEGLDPEIAAAAEKAARSLEDQGATVEEADPPLGRPLEMIRALWWPVATATVDAVPPPRRAEMDPGYLHIAERGRRYTTADYLAAYNARPGLHNAMLRFHERYDLLLTPAMPVAALKVRHEVPERGFGDDWLNWSPYTYPFNLTQQPAASVPCGLTRAGLPIGLQIVGAPHADGLVLRAARAVEQAMPFPRLPQRP
jgi:aspartyl-tRNA(Asn)/glutamyl-tRNA(Gln) amidotransferase subunit A